MKSRRVRVLRPQKGAKRRLVAMAEENAELALKNLGDSRTLEKDLLQRLARCLRLPQPPQRIECIDNSNLSGTNPVAGLVVFENARPSPAAYRRYVIQKVKGPDDYASMAEVLGRRFAAREASAALPDLLMLDGGRGQLSIALTVLKTLGLEGRFQLLAIAKKDDSRGVDEDRIYLPGRANPLAFGRDRDVLLFLQRIRNEAHRYAVSYHRRRRGRAALASELDDIRGIGPKRKRALLKRFGGVDGIRRAPLDEIAATPGIDRRTAMSLVLGLSSEAAPEAPTGDDGAGPG